MGDIRKSQPPAEKRFNCNFVRGVEDAAGSTTGFQSGTAQTQTGKSPDIGLLKMEATCSKQVEAAEVAIRRFACRTNAVGVSERILDRHSHIRYAQLRHDRSITKFYHGMDHRFRVNHHVDLL